MRVCGPRLIGEARGWSGRAVVSEGGRKIWGRKIAEKNSEIVRLGSECPHADGVEAGRA